MSDEHPVRHRGAVGVAGGAAKRAPHARSTAEGTAFERVISFVSPRAAAQFLLLVLVITLVNSLVLDRRFLAHG